jgi:hypothetical protein
MCLQNRTRVEGPLALKESFLNARFFNTFHGPEIIVHLVLPEIVLHSPALNEGLTTTVFEPGTTKSDNLPDYFVLFFFNVCILRYHLSKPLTSLSCSLNAVFPCLKM